MIFKAILAGTGGLFGFWIGAGTGIVGGIFGGIAGVVFFVVIFAVLGALLHENARAFVTYLKSGRK